MELFKDLNERQARHFAAIIAERNGWQGVSLVCAVLPISRKTVYRGFHELDSGEHPGEGRIRKKGGGRKSTLLKHPEYITIFREIVEFDIAGNPQDADTKWLRLTPSEIQQIFSEQYHTEVSLYTVRQIVKAEGFTRRKPVKILPMADCKLRDEQFKNIDNLPDTVRSMAFLYSAWTPRRRNSLVRTGVKTERHIQLSLSRCTTTTIPLSPMAR